MQADQKGNTSLLKQSVTIGEARNNGSNQQQVEQSPWPPSKHPYFTKAECHLSRRQGSMISTQPEHADPRWSRLGTVCGSEVVDKGAHVVIDTCGRFSSLSRLSDVARERLGTHSRQAHEEISTRVRKEMCDRSSCRVGVSLRGELRLAERATARSAPSRNVAQNVHGNTYRRTDTAKPTGFHVFLRRSAIVGTGERVKHVCACVAVCSSTRSHSHSFMSHPLAHS